MNLNELDSFKLSDAIHFHDDLNPEIFTDEVMRPEVRKQLLLIARDFMDHMGVNTLTVTDIRLVGSNAAYTYTPHSDLDLHILVDIGKLRDDPVYRELFTSKKTLYNMTHDIKIHGFDVELYIQDKSQHNVSLGEYSVLKNKWVKFPSKRRAELDKTASKEKFMKLVRIAEYALRNDDLEMISSFLETVRKYRKAGLDIYGEFSPENLAFKALRNQGIIEKLYNHTNDLHSKQLSIKEGEREKSAYSIYDIASKHNVSVSYILDQLKHGSTIESEHVSEADAAKIALANIAKDPDYYNVQITDEDYDPNGPPPGPEFKPTMPKGTVKVDVSDVYDWYKLGQHISNLKGLGKHDFGQGPPSTIFSFGDEDTEHEYIKDLEKTGLTTTDIDPIDPNQPKGMKRQKTDPTYNVDEVLDEEKFVLKLSGNRRAKDWIEKVYSKFPSTWQNNHVMMWGDGDDKQLAMFELVPSGKKDAVEVKWFQAYPLRQGIGSKALKVLQDLAREDGITLTLYPWDKGQVSQSSLMKFYRAHGFKPVTKGSKNLYWEPINEASGYIPSEKEKNDWRWKTALTIDVHPNSIKDNADKLGLGRIKRTGVPPTANTSGKIK